MVTDNLTNTVYFSELTRKDFPNVMEDLCGKLRKHGVEHGFLLHTKDYWCRDYMPIQVKESQYIRYLYSPDYLMDKRAYITNPDKTLAELDILTLKTNLILDGGNVIKCPHKVIMTEKVFYENKHLRKNEVISALEQLFGCEIVFLPWDRTEIYGHADGIVRWINGNSVLLTAYEESYYFSRKFREILQRHFDVIPMKYTTRPRNRQLTWAYINFLQTKNLIVVPAFNIQEDEQALQQIENAFPDYHGRIESVNTSDIIHHGGGLNCISWNIYKSNR